jgi:3-hydroxybutyryl-CoA dehydratase
MEKLVRGKYFEEFGMDFEIRSVGRTITETDVVSFAGLSGDYNQIHTDNAFATESGFGQRVAHGMLVLSIASGLAVQTGILEGTIMAFREISNWKFTKPIYFGDTIFVELKVVEKKAFPRLGGGTVSLQVLVKKHTNEVAMKGNWTMLVMSKPTK